MLQEKFASLETILNDFARKHSNTRFKLWTKGDIARMYIYDDCLYSTKKCKQSAYIDLKRYVVNVNTECSSQNDAWRISQSEQSEKHFETWVRFARFIAYKLGIISIQNQNQKEKIIEQSPVNETFPIIKGYWMEWREVRVSINRFGKLATRNRQYIRTFEGYANLTPHGFIELTNEQFEVAKTKDGKMIEPYSTPEF